MKVYLILVTYNGSSWIQKCLKSIENSDYKLSVIVVDNASTDNTCQIIQSKFDKFRLIKLEQNLGFGQANNLGIKMAYNEGADYIFLLNQDAYIEKHTISSLILAHENNSNFDLISPIHLNGSGESLDILFSSFVEPKVCPEFYSDCFMQKLQDKIYEAQFVNAAAWLLTRKCVATVGGFSPVFYHYGEDNNYCDRVHFHKLKMGIYPFSTIRHDKEYKTNPFVLSELLLKTNELVKFSNPEKGILRLNEEINLYFKSSIKFLFKIDIRMAYLSFNKFRELKKLKNRILSFVEQSCLKSPSFL
jgi:GT2 family glycosyltransferase